MFRNIAPGDKVIVKFCCLNCGKQGLIGTQNSVTGELHPSGLLKHIKLKRTNGLLLCKEYYQQLGESDFQSSLQQE